MRLAQAKLLGGSRVLHQKERSASEGTVITTRCLLKLYHFCVMTHVTCRSWIQPFSKIGSTRSVALPAEIEDYLPAGG